MNVIRRLDGKYSIKDEAPISEEVMKKLIVTKKDFEIAFRNVTPSAMREVLVETPNVPWDRIGGLNDIKERLKESVEWPLKNPKIFSRMGVRAPKGILLYGPPGTGKTLLAKAVATESEANFISVKGPELLNKYVGESEKGVRDIFRKAKQVAPSIIFFDEIDSIGSARGGSDATKVREGVINQILTEIDGVEDLSDVIIIGATNRPELIDPALLRPGRFDRHLLVGPPTKKGIEEILQVHLKKDILPRGITYKKLSEKLSGYTGADIEAVVRESVIAALREDKKTTKIKEKHISDAIKKIKPSINKNALDAYEGALKEVEKGPDYLG